MDECRNKDCLRSNTSVVDVLEEEWVVEWEVVHWRFSSNDDLISHCCGVLTNGVETIDPQKTAETNGLARHRNPLTKRYPTHLPSWSNRNQRCITNTQLTKDLLVGEIRLNVEVAHAVIYVIRRVTQDISNNQVITEQSVGEPNAIELLHLV